MDTSREATFRRSLAAIFRAELARHGWHQEVLAEKIGSNQPTISRKLRAESPISFPEARDLCNALGIDFDKTIALAFDYTDAADPFNPDNGAA